MKAAAKFLFLGDQKETLNPTIPMFRSTHIKTHLKTCRIFLKDTKTLTYFNNSKTRPTINIYMFPNSFDIHVTFKQHFEFSPEHLENVF